jgi:hypothetical protein
VFSPALCRQLLGGLIDEIDLHIESILLGRLPATKVGRDGRAQRGFRRAPRRSMMRFSDPTV